MTEVIKACSPAPLVVAQAGDPGTGQRAVLSKKLWPVGQQIYYGYLDGDSSNKAKAVDATIQTWMTFANIIFNRTRDMKTATIRISFLGSGSWSAVGTDASNIKDTTKPTMNLGWISDTNPPSAEDRGTILHEFGHALGMMHEHQSPARGEFIHLKELAVYNYYKPLLNNDASLVKTQVIDVYNLSDVSNYSHLDLKSIMMYFMPASLNREGIKISPNVELSQLDKAFITLSYPRLDSDVPSGGMKVLDALNLVNVPANISSNILGLLANSDFYGVRTAFNTYNLEVMSLTTVCQSFISAAGVDVTEGGQYGIRDAIGGIINNPMFKSILKNVVNGVFTARAIPTVNDIPGAAQNDVLDTIGTVATNPTFAQSIYDLNTYFSGVAPTSPTPAS